MGETRLREILRQRKISIKKCSEDTGISYRTLIRYLNGEDGRMEYFRVLSSYLGVSLDELLTGDAPPARK